MGIFFILTESLYGTGGPDVDEFEPRFANVDITRSSVIRDLSPSEVEQLSEHLNIKIKTETSRVLSSIERKSLLINRPLALRGHVTNASFKQ